VFVDMTGALIDRHEAADMFRKDLLTAKVDRAELLDTSSPLRRQVRLHDLRASMVTIGLANGRPEEWVRRRTGHTSSALERYRRVAATLRELTLGDWTPLDGAIPEVAAVCRKNAAANAAAAPKKPTGKKSRTSTISSGRGDWIRTSDPLTPSQVR
jgi:hypothetical protein